MDARRGERLSRWCAVVVLAVVVSWVSLVEGQCRSSADCIVDTGFSRCNTTSGQCDCSFARHKHGFYCDKVCDDDGQRTHCVQGVCTVDSLSFFDLGECACDPGYTTDSTTGLCTEPICSRPCQNGGFCVSPDVCLCDDGYTGAQCEMQLTCPFIATPGSGTTLLFMQNGVQHQSFDCNRGYVLNGSSLSVCLNDRWDPARPPSCVDYDECAADQHDCDRRCGSCVNLVGTYTCDVPPENANLVYDTTQQKCCKPGEPCVTKCFLHRSVDFGRVTYNPPLFFDTDTPLATTEASVMCNPGYVVPGNGTSKVTCTKNGVYDGTLSNCVPIIGPTMPVATVVGGGNPDQANDAEEAASGRKGSNTALVASLVTVSVLLILAVLVFLYFRARKPEHKYSMPPTAESPPLDKPRPSVSGPVGRGPQMHSAPLPAALAASVSAAPPPPASSRYEHAPRRGGRGSHDDDGIIYASAETWTDNAALPSGLPRSTTPGLGGAAAAPSGSYPLVDDHLQHESQHYASCDLALNGHHDDEPYEDASSVSPLKATTLPNSLPAQLTFLGEPANQADTLPVVSPNRKAAASAAIAAAAAAATKKRPTTSKVRTWQRKHQQPGDVPRAQRPSAVLQQRLGHASSTAPASEESEYENPSQPSSPPSSPPCLTSQRSHTAVIHSFQQHIEQHPVVRPTSTSPPLLGAAATTTDAALAGSTSPTSGKSTSPPPTEIPTKVSTFQALATRPARPGRPPTQLPKSAEQPKEELATAAAAPPQLPSKDGRPLLVSKSSGASLVKPSHPPPQIPTGADQISPSSTLSNRSSGKSASDTNADDERQASSSDTEPETTTAAGGSGAKPPPPQLPSKLSRPKLDTATVSAAAEQAAEPSFAKPKPSRPPRPNVAPVALMSKVSGTSSDDGYLSPSDDGYISPTCDNDGGEEPTRSAFTKPRPPRKLSRPSFQHTDSVDSDSHLLDRKGEKPTPPAKHNRPTIQHGDSIDGGSSAPEAASGKPVALAPKPAPPPKAGRPSLTGSGAGADAQEKAEEASTLPNVARKPANRIAPPRTASMPRYPSPLPPGEH